MLTFIDVKFIFDSVCLALSISANILQIADIALRVVLNSYWFCYVFSYYFAYFLKQVKCPPFLLSQPKQLHLISGLLG